MALNIGELVAYINVDPSRAENKLANFQRKLERTGTGISDRFKSVGDRVSGVGSEVSGVGQDLTRLTAPAGAAALAVGGITAALGWGRLKSIDSAQAQLRGLGYEAEDVERISSQVSSALEGGMMDLGSGTRVAAGALAAGVAEGKELERYIGLVDAAAIGMNATTDETAMIFNRIEGSGKVMRTELDMVEQRMPGFSGAMAKHLGVTSEEFTKMVSDGKVSSDDFMDVMEGFAGGMASEYSKSWEGMVSNTKAYVGMIGQSLLGGVFEQSKDSIAGLIEWLKDPDVQERAAALGESIGSAFTSVVDLVKGAIDWFLQLDGTWQKLILAAGGIAVAIGPVLLIIGKIIGTVGTMISVAGTIFGWITKLSGVFGLVGKAITIVSTAARALWMVLAANPVGLIIAGIVALIAGLVLFFRKTEVGQRIWAKVWGAIKGAALAVWDWVKDTLWPGLLAAWDAISAGAVWLYENGIKPAWEGIQTAISAVADWITGTAWPALQTAWDAIAGAVMWLWQSVIQPAWEGIKLAIAIVVTAVQLYIDLLVWYFDTVLAPVVMWLWRNVIQPAWNGIKTAIGAVVDWFQNTAWPALQAAIDWIGTAFNTMRDWISAAWTFIKDRVIAPVVSWFQNTVWPLIDKVIGWIGMSFEGWKLLIQAVWKFVQDRVIKPVVNWFQNTVWPTFKRVLGYIGDGFEAFKRGLDTVWSFIKDRVIQPVVDWFDKTIQPKLTRVTETITSAFDTMKAGIQKAWDAIKDAARAPVRFVVEDVYNDTLRSTFNGVADKLNLNSKWRLPAARVGFASGGIMPGYTPGRDVHEFYSPTAGRLSLSGGEPILRPEAGRVLGAGWVHGINAAARSGGVNGVQSFLGRGHQEFKSGGIWGRITGAAGSAWDWAKDKASTIAEAVADPAGVLTKLAGKAVDLIPGSGMIRELTAQAGKNVAKAIGEWMSGKTTPAAGSMGSGGSLAWASQLARKYGLTMTSGYRPGARTSSGSLSMHGLNRARDYSNSYGPTPEMMQFALAVLRGSSPTELLYTPLGALNVHRGGRQYPNSGAVARLHNNHVHVAYKRGGILGALDGSVGGYEKGTLSASPGWHMVGEAGPELVRFRGGEQVRTTEETARALGAGLTDEEMERFAQIVAAEVRDGSREGVAAGLSGSASRARSQARMGVL